MQRNLVMLQEIQQDISTLSKRLSGALISKGKEGLRKVNDTPLGAYSRAFSRYSEPPLSPISRWRIQKYRKFYVLQLMYNADLIGVLTITLSPLFWELQ